MLRISGRRLDVDKLLSHVTLKPTQVYRKGEPVLPRTQPDGRKLKMSGIGFVASGADFDQFEKQKRDAISFLKSRATTIRKIMDWPGVEGGELDFGISERDGVVQCNLFPAELLRLAGGLGLNIELSLYPPIEEEKKRKKPTRKSRLPHVPLGT